MGQTDFASWDETMRLFVVRETAHDLFGAPTDVDIVAGPYSNTQGGVMEAEDACKLLATRHPELRFRVIGVQDCEVRLDRAMRALHRRPAS